MIAIADPTFDYQPAILSPRVLSALRPRPRVRSWDWINTNGRTPGDGTRQLGKPFDGQLVPWCEGVCDAFDDPAVRKIVMMWGTRLGKTLISMELMACVQTNNPLPGLFATANEKLATRTTRNKIYPILEAVESTRRQLLPEHLRNIRELRLAESTWAIAWAGSNTLLADWSACYGWANEVDKWPKKTPMDGQGQEGDELAQFFQRFKDWADHKIILECSPSLRGHSRIESEYLQSNQCHFYVPCPKCGARFVLRMGSADPDSGGLKFDKLSDGHLDADTARQTSRYICHNAKCRAEIHDEDRFVMMRAGKWAPKGCTVNADGELCGKPERTCTVWGGQLSSLYSLQLRWGDIAAEFVNSRGNKRTLQVFVNGTLSETWEPFRAKSEPEQVAERLATNDVVGTMPDWSTWLFSAVDVQAEYFKWAKVGAGPNERAAIIDRGVCDTWQEVYEHCVNSPTPHADGSTPLLPCLTFIDSGDGHKTDEVYEKCREWSRLDRLVLPCKGANTDCAGEPYQRVTIGDGTKRGSRIQKRQALRAVGVIRIRINSYFYEPIIQRWLDASRPGEDDSLTIPQDLADDEDFIRELCNGAMSDNPSKMDPDRLLWVKRWGSEPNDFRDCLKYARCAMDVKFRGNWRMAERRQTANSAPVAAVRNGSPAVDEPMGRRGRRFRVPRERTRRR